MALKDADIENFKSMVKAAKAGDLGLMECVDAVTGEYRAVIAAASQDQSGIVNFVPFGHMATSNPYDEYVPPEME